MHLKASLPICLLAFAGLAQAQVDLSKAVTVLPFESAVQGAGGLPEATRTAVIQFLKDAKVFAGVFTPEAAKDNGGLELRATLADFAPGNMATRVMVGLGTGRAHAGFDFTVMDSGRMVWQKRIKETASFWSNSASSVSQRQELPEKIAKTLVKELQKVKAK